MAKTGAKPIPSAFNPSNNSTTGGFLGPKAGSAIPIQDIALQDFLQKSIAGVSGLDPVNVRPKWQRVPPNLPDITGATTWCSYGITSRQQSTFGYEEFDLVTSAYTVRRNENIDLLLNFYGGNSDAAAMYFRLGIELAQNRELLKTMGFDSKYVGEQQNVPEMINNLWLQRSDIQWRLSREVAIIYDIQSIASLTGTITRDTSSTVIPFIN